MTVLKDKRIHQLEEQLRISQEQLRSTTAKLATSNEGFFASNEELMTINEELHCINEELETFKAELQTLNEELVTVNTELQGKVAELNQANSDMENLFASSGIATIFLDRQLVIKRYSPAMAVIFNLIPTDIGRPLTNLAGTLDLSGLTADVDTVLEKLVPVEREVAALDHGRHYLMRILPYWTMAGEIDGVVVTLVDITEHKRLAEQTVHLASFPQLNPNPVLEIDAEGRIIFTNPATWEILLQLGEETTAVTKFLPVDFKGILKSWDRTCELTLYREIAIKGKSFGETLLLSPRFDVVRIYAYDITGLKQAEGSLRQAKEEWERTFDSVPDLISILDDRHRIVRVNRAMAERLGVTADDCIGKTCFQCLHGTDEPAGFFPHSLSLKDGRENVVEVYEERLGGYFLVTTTPLLDESGQMVGTVHVARDITERKQAEEALQRSEEHFRTLANAIPNLCWMANADGWIFWYNRRWYDYTGTTSDQMEGWGWQSVHDPAMLPSVMEQWQLSITTGLPFDMVFPLRGADGLFRPFLTRVLPVCDQDGKVLRWFGTNTDISAQRKAEEALRESESRVRRKLESILTPEGDTGILELADIIDVESMQSLMDSFNQLTRMPMGLIDLKGKVLVGVGWQDICTKFHRQHPDTCKNCIESDSHLSAGVPPGEYKLYKCKNNMWDVATPIIVDGRHFGNFFMGQFFLEDEPLDHELFSAQARRYGFDEKEYTAALERVPRLSREVLDTGMAYFIKLADMISQMSYSNLKLARSLTERDSLLASLEKSSERINLLAGIASALLTSESPLGVIDNLCQKVMAFLDCQVFFNFVANEHEGRLHLNSFAGIREDEAKKIEWLDYGVEVSGCVARDAASIVFEDIQTTADPRTEMVKSFGIKAYACLPLLTQGQVLGTISFGARSRTHFSADDLSLMKALADQFSIAIERTRTEKALLKARDKMEHKVQERTVELASTVETLLGEITVRQRAEAGLVRLNRLYAVLSETNQAIVRATDRAALFQDFCHIAVEHGGFRLSWIGLVDKESGRVNIVTASGATAYLDDIVITAGKEPEGEGPSGNSIRHGHYYICNDFQNDPCTRPWHEKGRAHGIHASAAIALKEDNCVIGSLTLYAGERNFFDNQHVALLQQIASDISFALDNLKQEARRREAEKALQEETLERLRTAEALREREQLLIQQSRLAAMGEMINNIAHQWRQPLNVLGLNIQRLMLFYEMGDFNREFLQTSTADAMKLIKHMSQTIDDFRNFFKADKAKSRFSLNQAIQLTLSLIGDGLKNNQIEIVLQIDGDPFIDGYYNEFCQVLLNLLQNACDVFLERKIASRKVTIAAAAENNRTVITISDNAGGIPAELTERIFEPYFSTKGLQGTGIGLFMSKNIIETNMGGSITASNSAAGAAFRIEV